jgi:hypothetical protein
MAGIGFGGWGPEMKCQATAQWIKEWVRILNWAGGLWIGFDWSDTILTIMVVMGCTKIRINPIRNY